MQDADWCRAQSHVPPNILRVVCFARHVLAPCVTAPNTVWRNMTDKQSVDETMPDTSTAVETQTARQENMQLDGSPPVPPPKLHMDALSAGMLNALRYLSTKPRKKNWAFFVPAEAVACLLRTGGCLQEAAQNIFTTLELSGMPAEDIRRGTLVFCNDEENLSQAELIISKIGLYLEHLHVEGYLSKIFSQFVVMHCVGLRSLSVKLHPDEQCNIFAFFKMHGAKLESLELRKGTLFEANISAVSSFCVSLRHLPFSEVEFEASLSPLWEAIGSDLQSLEIECPIDHGVLDIPVCVSKCKKIYKLSLFEGSRND